MTPRGGKPIASPATGAMLHWATTGGKPHAPYPDKIAVVDNHGASWTYAALDCAASRLANWLLSQGIQPGDRVAFQLPGWCEFTLIYLACLKTGAVSVPLLPAWREAELVWVLNKCQAKYSSPPPYSNRIVRSILSFRYKINCAI
ncbi:short chain acyl-CoA synthetase [Salmonella enterica subsp. enterica]|nr:short chain acyl-CoA synthetase [Salmonella enterica subsp. enterica]